MSEPSRVKLGNLINFQRGYDLPKRQFVDGEYPVVSSNGILGYHNEYKVKGPGITIGRSGTVGLPHYIESDFFPHNTALFVEDFKGNHKKYIYYLIQNLGLNKQKSGSGVPTMNRNHLHPLEVLAHTQFETQEKIAKVLSALEAKIELNNRINTELEATAKTLYDYWFVQFDFPFNFAQGKPDVNGKPYKTYGGIMVYNPTLKREIPEGWEPVSVSDLLAIKTGKEDANYATDDGQYHFFTCGEAPLRCDDFIFEGKAVLLAGNGSFAVKRYEGKFNAYQRTYVLMPNEEKYFAPLYFSVLARVQSLTSGSRGSIVKFITKGDIESIYIPLPVDRTIDFSSVLGTLFSKSTNIYNENLELVKLRDWLLPMLMNGQVTVKQ
ncbi:restriction endonuclease subunit S [Nitrosomonas nitrosa]|uniref:Type I restriction enzyme, S subunit n=1 Tax=Nitrosomonas nitrosa TaxID=52442 RepID=A0A1I4MP81_9PROT|nr:restriction endonuclease subunit S [Nitrosomonas nitrosa]MCO6433643.1 restriction endonuclease subunit S [Nitrosomonas nitrosa]SFM04856.1 type I restriction enzyme, S subunit [Nitrosomonas nitrosa]